jgi:hypothetical protein
LAITTTRVATTCGDDVDAFAQVCRGGVVWHLTQHGRVEDRAILRKVADRRFRTAAPLGVGADLDLKHDGGTFGAFEHGLGGVERVVRRVAERDLPAVALRERHARLARGRRVGRNVRSSASV